MADDGHEDMRPTRSGDGRRAGAATPRDADKPSDAPKSSDPGPAPENTKTSSDTAEWTDLEQRVLGAVRQAVTDAMKDGKQPADLPNIDMDFVASPSSGPPQGQPASDRAPRSNSVGAPVDTPIRTPIQEPTRPPLSAPVRAPSPAPIHEPAARSVAPLPFIGGGLAVVAAALLAVFQFGVLGPADNQGPAHIAAGSVDSVGRNGETDRQKTVSTPGRERLVFVPNIEKDSQSEPAERQHLAPIKTVDETAKREAAKEKLMQAEAAERQRLAAINAAEQEARREAAEQKRLQAESAERQRLAAIKAAEQAARREAAEQERQQAQEAERQRLAAIKAAEQEARREAAEQKRRQAEDAKRQRLAAIKAAEQEARREAAEQKRRQAENAERQRLAAIKAAEQEARREAAEQKRRQAEDAERQRLAAIKAAEQEARREAAEQKRRQAEDAERQRLTAIKAAEQEARREAAERKRQQAQEAERKRLAAIKAVEQEARRKAAQNNVLRDAGNNEAREIEELAEAQKKRLQAEIILSDRLASALDDRLKARTLSSQANSNGSGGNQDLPLDWADEEKVRLRLQELLANQQPGNGGASAPALRAGPQLARQVITVRLKQSNLEITGVLKSFDKINFVIVVADNKLVTVPVEHFDCIRGDCPDKRP